MNDIPPDGGTPAAAVPATAPSPASQPAAVPWSRWLPAWLVAFALIVLFGWQWIDTRTQLDGLRQELARRLAEADVQSKESRRVSTEVQEATREAQVKLGVLETRLAESQNQQIALESLYQELTRNRDEWAFAEIEQSLLIASQQLQLAGNVKAALFALQNADARLQRNERPQFTALRRAINRDIERLKALPYVDTVGISVRIDALINAVDKLPLAMELRPQPDATRPVTDAQAGAWLRFWREAWNDMKQLVRVQHIDQPDVPLLTPSQSFFLRENLKLRLIGARLALLVRDETSYKDDLKAARDWINRYYDTRDKAVAGTLTSVNTLYQSSVSLDVPDITATLEALRSVRLTRERAAR